MKFREISEHEFKGMYQFFKNSKPDFGVTGSYTRMSDNYTETNFGADGKCLLRTEHANGVNNTPVFYEAIHD